MKKQNTQVFALGGLGEVGKNMYCVKHDNEIIIVDAGVMFPEDDLLGIDYVIPDFTYLIENQDKIKYLLITHGHEDHIGGIPFLLQQVSIPKIYAPNQAKELIEKKLEERNIKYKDLYVYNEKTSLKTNYFNIEFFRTTHSIPDSHGISITTPNGVIVMTGDFKFDFTPVGPMANLHKMAAIGKKGVKLLMSDSTNALSEGVSVSESKVDENLGEIFKNNQNSRIILATFASNIYRLKHIIETCKENNRKVALFGRSMDTSIEIATKCGYIKDKSIIITAEEANQLHPSKVCLLCTGSQGEPLAALSRIASGTHKQIKLIPNDIVIFSSSPIPGNTSSVSKTINKLYLKGVKVYTNGEYDIHSSGHAYQEELKLMIRLFKPEYFAPYHGEYRMLKTHTDLADECGVKKSKTFILSNGDILNMNEFGIKQEGHIQAGEIYVDGSRIGDVSNVVIKDRTLMSSNGILAIIINIDSKNKMLLNNPLVTTRGFILVNESLELIKKIELESKKIINKHLKENNNVNFQDIKNELINGLVPTLSKNTGRVPIILPVIMDIKDFKTQIKNS